MTSFIEVDYIIEDGKYLNEVKFIFKLSYIKMTSIKMLKTHQIKI